MEKFLNEIRFHLFQMRQNFNDKRVLRGSFILQIVNMMISNTAFFIIWLMFSKTIGTHHGWGPLQTFGMLSVMILVFGITHGSFGSLMFWPRRVPSGSFDSLLTKPKNLYIRIINHEFMVSALGDLFQGLIGVIIFTVLSHASLISVLMLGALIIPAVITEIAFFMICGCMIFWLPQAPGLPQALTNLILTPATQPTSLLKGGMRYLYLFVIPALVISGLPIETFIHASWKLFLLAYGIAGFWLWLSVFVLRISVRRYESGNSIGA